jgi:2-oxoglutarate ferredoxin oxidoreductase subunit alpha
MRRNGHKLAYVHLKYLNPLPKNLGDILKRFKKIVLPKNNSGQLKFILQAKYLVDIIGFNKIQGQTFRTYEIEQKIEEILRGEA